MTTLNLNEEVIDLNYTDKTGKIHTAQVEVPKVKHQRELARRLKAIDKGDEDAELDVSINWLAELGLPKDMAENMSTRGLKKLVSALSAEDEGEKEKK